MATTYLRHFPQPLLDDLVIGRWLPVVGAGLSRNAVLPSGKNLPLWDKLGKAFAAEVSDYAYVNPIDAVSAFEYEFGRPKLIEKLSEQLLIGEVRPGSAHRAFCTVPFDVVCTTNFDFLLERQYELISRPCTPLIDEDQLSINLHGSSVALLKLHGDLNHPKRLVATEEDYDAFLERYPVIATYLSNFLITRTAVLIGYSLDDPDFRQIWQVVGERLGKARRLAYVLSVGARPPEVARFERRGVKVINLPGSKQKYGEILTEVFGELRDYWRDNVVTSSYVTEEGPLRELSLPQDSATRLCFFALPLSALPFYRERVFPLVRNAGLVPVTANDIVSPGENFLAKIDALISRAELVAVDASSDATLAEARMVLSRKEPHKFVIIAEEGAQISSDLQSSRIMLRPGLASVDVQSFLNSLEEWLDQAARDLEPTLSSEPRRLLTSNEHRAAVISAITHLEMTLRERLDLQRIHLRQRRRGKVISVAEMLNIARERNLLGKFEVKQVLEWLYIRNHAVHSRANVTAKIAQDIVDGVEEITGLLNSTNGAGNYT